MAQTADATETSWQYYLDERTGYHYWWNADTGESQWDSAEEASEHEAAAGTPAGENRFARPLCGWARHGWGGTAGTARLRCKHGMARIKWAPRFGLARPARHGVARPGMAGTARHCTAGDGLVWLTQGQKGAKPLACTTNLYLRPQRRLIWPMPARHGAHWHGYGEFLQKARPGWHSTAGTARRIYLAKLAR